MHSVIHTKDWPDSHNGDYVKWFGCEMNSKNTRKMLVDNAFFKSVFIQTRYTPKRTSCKQVEMAAPKENP